MSIDFRVTEADNPAITWSNLAVKLRVDNLKNRQYHAKALHTVRTFTNGHLSTTVTVKSSYCRVARQGVPCYTTVARLGFKRRATSVLKLNLIRSIEFGTAVARRLKQALVSRVIQPGFTLESCEHLKFLSHFPL